MDELKDDEDQNHEMWVSGIIDFVQMVAGPEKIDKDQYLAVQHRENTKYDLLRMASRTEALEIETYIENHSQLGHHIHTLAKLDSFEEFTPRSSDNKTNLRIDCILKGDTDSIKNSDKNLFFYASGDDNKKSPKGQLANNSDISQKVKSYRKINNVIEQYQNQRSAKHLDKNQSFQNRKNSKESIFLKKKAQSSGIQCQALDSDPNEKSPPNQTKSSFYNEKANTKPTEPSVDTIIPFEKKESIEQISQTENNKISLKNPLESVIEENKSIDSRSSISSYENSNIFHNVFIKKATMLQDSSKEASPHGNDEVYHKDKRDSIDKFEIPVSFTDKFGSNTSDIARQGTSKIN